jgi:heavy metal sensor kinase
VARTIRRTRVRLTVASAGIFALVAVLGAVAVWLTVNRIEMGAIDASLQSQAATVTAALNDQNGQVTLSGGDALPTDTPEGVAVGVTLVAGGHASTTAGPAVGAAESEQLAAAAGARGTSVFSNTSAAGQPLRVLAVPVTGNSDVLVLSRSLTETNRSLLQLALGLAAVVVVLIAAVALLGYRLAGRALRPVREMAVMAREISDRDLHRRIDLDLPDDELGQLAATLNEMLARLETAFGGLQRFTADAAHELRAPLTLMRTELETALRRRARPSLDESEMRSLLEETNRLSRMADQLLLLARADAGELGVSWTTVDVSDLVEETADRWRATAAGQGVEIRAAAPDTGALQGDPELLRRLLDNLLSNAVRHTPAGGVVTVAAGLDDGQWLITVADTGTGVPTELRGRLFDRFSRAAGARGRDQGGAGLGLSLAAAIVAAHGGAISLRTAAPRGAVFEVRLPIRQASARMENVATAPG